MLLRVASVLDQPDAANVSELLLHQFDHVEALNHPQDGVEAAGHKRRVANARDLGKVAGSSPIIREAYPL